MSSQGGDEEDEGDARRRVTQTASKQTYLCYPIDTSGFRGRIQRRHHWNVCRCYANDGGASDRQPQACASGRASQRFKVPIDLMLGRPPPLTRKLPCKQQCNNVHRALFLPVNSATWFNGWHRSCLSLEENNWTTDDGISIWSQSMSADCERTSKAIEFFRNEQPYGPAEICSPRQKAMSPLLIVAVS